MISKNEGHNIDAVMDSIDGFAAEVFLVDSYSADDTVNIALSRGVNVVQRPFRNFGDQWNFAVQALPITMPWTMKLDPDERLTDELKDQISHAITQPGANGYTFPRRLWFMGRPISVKQDVLRLWRSGTCRFTNSEVNEHPIVDGRISRLTAELEHHDSPNLHHWYEKQNRYSTVEARVAITGRGQTALPNLFGGRLERRAFLKAAYNWLPFRHMFMQMYCILALGAWRGGRVGFIWARMRAEVYRMRELKRLEMRWLGFPYDPPEQFDGAPHPEVRQFTINADD